MPRNYQKVIEAIKALVPETEIDFHSQLGWNAIDGQYKAPEETLHWERLTATVHRNIPPETLRKNSDDWKIGVYSALSTIDIDTIKNHLQE